MPGRALILLLPVTLLAIAGGGSVAEDRAEASSKPGKAKAKHGSGKRTCKKGYKPVRATRKGTRAWKCVKRRGADRGKGKRGPGPAPGSGPAAPGGTGGGQAPGGPATTFEAPGRQLSGEAARPFLERYLVNSTFTDCPTGWPTCAVEERYSHTGGTLYHCRLTPTSGSDIRNAFAYAVQNAVVEADGSWTFNEVVDNYGSPAVYEWHLTPAGVVTGAYQYNGVEQLGPFQYVSGARDCSY